MKYIHTYIKYIQNIYIYIRKIYQEGATKVGHMDKQDHKGQCKTSGKYWKRLVMVVCEVIYYRRTKSET